MRVLLLLLLPSLPLCAFDAARHEFPKLSDAQRLSGELVGADYIHRSGQFRTEKGDLKDFRLLPYGVVKYRGSESDLRDVPLGAKLDFFLLPDSEGRPTRLLTTSDNQSRDPEQQKKFREFTEMRGLAGWIDKTEGRNVTVTFFSGDPAALQEAWGALLAKGKEGKLCVANDELRTWNPGVDGERSSFLEVEKVPTDGFGCSGVRVTMSVSNMLEGFRRGRVVRVFLAGWKVQDQFYGESLMGYGFSRMLNQDLVENVAKEYQEQFPFRTDFGNEHMSWYALQPGMKPPQCADHLVFGELVKADAATRTGQFRMDRTGELIDFTLLPDGSVKYLNADATLSDVPVGTRCRFHLFQDDKDAFTQAMLIKDEFTHLAANATTLRLQALRLGEGRIQVAAQLAEVKDYNGDMKRPPDISACYLNVSKDTRVWKADKQAALSDLTVGDTLLVNLTGELPGQPSRCTDIWIGEETHKQVTDQRQKRPAAPAKPKA
jgi:hypothetical protein